MVEAGCFALISLAFSAFASLACMITVNVFNHEFHRVHLGHLFTLVFWCTSSTGLLALAKYRIGKPTFNTACSLAALVFFSMLTYEGSVQAGDIDFRRLGELLKIVLFGIFISILVCTLLWSRSAIVLLQKDLSDLTASTSLMFGILLRDFTSITAVASPAYTKISKQMRADWAKVNKNLSEAKFEFAVLGRRDDYAHYRSVVQSMAELGQHLRGIHSSTMVQSAFALNTPNEGIHGEFMRHLAPPMRSLAYTCQVTMRRLPFQRAQANAVQLQVMYESVKSALTLYSTARKQAVDSVYADQDSPTARGQEAEEVAANLVVFSYSLAEFARELLEIIDSMAMHCRVQSHRVWKPFFPFDITLNSIWWFFNDRHRPLHTYRTSNKTFFYKLWLWLKWARSDDIKFAVKVGFGSTLLALPAFLDSTRSIFVSYRGEWALLSYFIVVAYSSGATNLLVRQRVFGTLVGGAVAVIAWVLFPAEPVLLAIIGVVFSGLCFRLIVETKNYQGLGRFILLTYNLSSLYAYDLSQDTDDRDNDDEGGLHPIITDIVRHRLVAVVVGVLWGLIVTLAVWPISARKKVREELSEAFLVFAWIFRRPETFISGALLDRTDWKELFRVQMTTSRGREIGNELSKIPKLLASAKSEFRFKGPFQHESYSKVLSLSEEILDSLTYMQLVLINMPTAPSLRKSMLESAQEEIDSLSDGIVLYFYLIASALRLKYPIPASLPPVQLALHRVIDSLISGWDRSRPLAVLQNEDFAGVYGYTLIIGQIAGILDSLRDEMEKLYQNEVYLI